MPHNIKTGSRRHTPPAVPALPRSRCCSLPKILSLKKPPREKPRSTVPVASGNAFFELVDLRFRFVSIHDDVQSQFFAADVSCHAFFCFYKTKITRHTRRKRTKKRGLIDLYYMFRIMLDISPLLDSVRNTPEQKTKPGGNWKNNSF